jgi:hypothetical protein
MIDAWIDRCIREDAMQKLPLYAREVRAHRNGPHKS